MSRTSLSVTAVGAALLVMPLTPAQVPDVELKEVIDSVVAAAGSGDLESLAKHMSDGFRYSFGDGESKQNALEAYKTHPELLNRMVKVISEGCVVHPEYSPVYYVCPPEFADTDGAYSDYRAGFVQEQGVWRYRFFVAGD